MAETYWLKAAHQRKWQKVSKKKFIEAERDAGFRPKLSSDDPQYMKVCATGGFGTDQIEGKIKYA